LGNFNIKCTGMFLILVCTFIFQTSFIICHVIYTFRDTAYWFQSSMFNYIQCRLVMRVFHTITKKYLHPLHNEDSQFCYEKLWSGNCTLTRFFKSVIQLKSRGSSGLVESLCLRTETERDNHTWGWGWCMFINTVTTNALCKRDFSALAKCIICKQMLY